MAQSTVVNIKGLFTSSNNLSEVPAGSLKVADNIVIQKDSVAESRRGFDRLAFTLPLLSDRADKLLQYQNTLLLHYGTSSLARYDSHNGVITYSGSYSHPDPSLAKIRSVEANQNLYFTSSKGIQKLDSVTGTPSQAGMYKGLDCLASAHTNVSGFMLDNAQVAYRHLWGITDANSNLILGYPSQRTVLANQSGGLQDVSLDITIPSGVTVNHFYQIYRSNQAAGVTVNATGTIQDITYTAVTGGTSGNSISVTYGSGGTAGAETVSVSSDAITVTIASGTSTANDILTAINNSTAALALVSAAISTTGQGSNTQTTGTVTLSGGDVTLETPDDNMQLVYEGTVSGSTLVVQDITYTSVLVGTSGNEASIEYTSGGTAGSEVVTVIGSAITVQIESGVSTATQVLAAINASTEALALVSAAITGTASNAQVTASATNLSGGTATITVVDTVPDSLKGAALYTNDTQEGILQANELPPYAEDIEAFRDCLFFANIKTKQRLQLSILSVGGTGGIQSGDTLTIAGTTYTAGASEDVSTKTYALVTSGSAAQNINDTALSLIRVINQNTANTTVYAYYVSTPTGLPGQILIEERILGGDAFSATVSGHGSAFSPTLPTSGSTVASNNQKALNGLMYSKQQQPDAVPLENILYVGSASKKILRIVALRDSLFILKEDGVYRCTGSDPSSFTIDLLDNTAFLLAPESAATLSNQIFALTSQGVVAISDVGVEVLSRPIEDKLVSLYTMALTPLKKYSFGVGYESERQYILWTVSTSGDTYATQAFIYNIFTKTWVRWTRSQQHALVLTSDDKIYAADPLSNNINQERKSGDFSDFSDEAKSVTLSSFSDKVLTFADVTDIAVGDIIYQSTTVSSVVTAVDTDAKTATVVDLINSWDTGADTFVLKSIACEIEWLPNFGQTPGYSKQWSEVILLLRQNFFNSASLGFYSDVSGSTDTLTIITGYGGNWGRFPWGTVAWGGTANSQPIRAYVPLEKQRCDLLSVQFICQQSWAQFQVEGIILTNRVVSPRVGR